MTCTHCNDVGYTEHYQQQTLSHYTLTCQQCFGTGVPVTCYAGIGSRKTPEDVLIVMSNIAMTLAMKGWALRSGGADGADKAFERGCDLFRGRKVIRADHPEMVMLGDRLDHPVSFVVCWTPGAAVTGGTGQALRIAGDTIPVFNLATPGAADRLWSWLDAK